MDSNELTPDQQRGIVAIFVGLDFLCNEGAITKNVVGTLANTLKKDEIK